MRRSAILSLVCLCGRTVELADAARQAKCECGRTLVVEAVRNDEMRTIAPDRTGKGRYLETTDRADGRPGC